MANWTQPICDDCWGRENPRRTAVRVLKPQRERCCVCGNPTSSGVYVRRDPATVPFPAKEEGR